jgi:hypothetical protein
MHVSTPANHGDGAEFKTLKFPLALEEGSRYEPEISSTIAANAATM